MYRGRWVLLKDAGLLSGVLTLFPRTVFAPQELEEPTIDVVGARKGGEMVDAWDDLTAKARHPLAGPLQGRVGIVARLVFPEQEQRRRPDGLELGRTEHDRGACCASSGPCAGRAPLLSNKRNTRWRTTFSSQGTRYRQALTKLR